ncbi:MAG: tRNA (adenosine(37)-N6)-threonylcarbamoyltransferase complex ATPase subunit type 1 TsaE [Bacteroidales bacterium]|nr:tRNA (adenosine(37)-N6)-threonylcarbamoyltransferase complex ATPase subunit type 1 TsaE [Bacteroidales bacterium]
MELYLNNLKDISSVAQQFLSKVEGKKKFAFYGKMGAGKTTFITAICEVLEALDVASSPTFALINEYQTLSGEIIYHIDFYRIKNSEELYDIGIEDYLYNDVYCFIEWSEKAEEIIPSDFIKVYLTEEADGIRKIQIHA